jgi:hypothetical protein
MKMYMHMHRIKVMTVKVKFSKFKKGDSSVKIHVRDMGLGK